jgi:long-subunit fatty acid transport protein
VNAYGALSLGYSREINEKWSVGTRVKLLSGIANVFTERSDIRLHIDEGLDPDVVPHTYTAQPNIAINWSLPEAGFSPIDNLGFALDLGTVYHLNDNLKFGASIYDIGHIKWTSGLNRATSKGQNRPFVFAGVDLGDLFGNDDGFEFSTIFSELLDSVKDFLQLNMSDSTFKSYKSSLRTSYNLSVFFDLTDNDQLGFMWNSQLNQGKYNNRGKNNMLTMAYTRTFGRNFQVCINNTIINENPFNFGGGFAANVGSFQIYFILDKINSHRVVDMRLGSMNFQFGVNFVFDRLERDPKKRQVERDFTPRDKTGYVNDRWFR